MKYEIKNLIEEIKEDFDILIEKLEDDEINEFELEDLIEMLESFKKEFYFYI